MTANETLVAILLSLVCVISAMNKGSHSYMSTLLEARSCFKLRCRDEKPKLFLLNDSTVDAQALTAESFNRTITCLSGFESTIGTERMTWY